MAAAPWQEHAYKVVVEFQKSSSGASRKIDLTHGDALPQQLYGRLDPQVWLMFMQDVRQLALSHPYTANPNAKQCCCNLGGLACCLVLGFGFFEPDGGDYGVWTSQVAQVIQRHQPAFGAAGCGLSLQQVHGSFWIQIDINPNAVAVGMPAPAYQQPQAPYPPPGQYPQGQYAQPQGQYAQPQGYPPQQEPMPYKG